MNPIYLELKAAEERRYQAAKTALQNAFELFKHLDETQKQRLYKELSVEEFVKTYFGWY